MNTEKPEHNPDGLTPEQYGAPEWRLLRRDENVQSGDQFWNASHSTWDDAAWRELPQIDTYRRRVTPIPATASEKLEGAESPEKDAEIARLKESKNEVGAIAARSLHREMEMKDELTTLREERNRLQTFRDESVKTELSLRAQLTAQAAIIGELVGALEKIETLQPEAFDKFPSDWSEQIAQCPECQGWCKTHPIMNGICDLHRRPLHAREDHDKREQRVMHYRMRDIAKAALTRAKEGASHE